MKHLNRQNRTGLFNEIAPEIDTGIDTPFIVLQFTFQVKCLSVPC